MVHGSKLRAVLRGKVLMLHLVRRRLDMVLVFRLHFRRQGMRLDAIAAVVADVVVVDDDVLRNDGAVLVDIGHVDATKVCHSTVVGEDSPTPLTPKEADAAIAESVVDSAVESDMRAPITGVPCVEAPPPSPIAGG